MTPSREVTATVHHRDGHVMSFWTYPGNLADAITRIGLFLLTDRPGAVVPGCQRELPPLSLSRVNHRQLARALAHHRDPSLATEFD
jgi:hypothetical protein